MAYFFKVLAGALLGSFALTAFAFAMQFPLDWIEGQAGPLAMFGALMAIMSVLFAVLVTVTRP